MGALRSTPLWVPRKRLSTRRLRRAGLDPDHPGAHPRAPGRTDGAGLHRPEQVEVGPGRRAGTRWKRPRRDAPASSGSSSCRAAPCAGRPGPGWRRRRARKAAPAGRAPAGAGVQHFEGQDALQVDQGGRPEAGRAPAGRATGPGPAWNAWCRTGPRAGGGRHRRARATRRGGPAVRRAEVDPGFERGQLPVEPVVPGDRRRSRPCGPCGVE